VDKKINFYLGTVMPEVVRVCVYFKKTSHRHFVFSSSLNGITDSLETYAQTSIPPGGSPTDPNPSGPGGGIPLDQLKQMLSSQLEYYFSRYVSYFM
jgi:hypothetical protein